MNSRQRSYGVCEKADIYTIDEFEHGNGALTQPIGLISVDEYVIAGSGNSYLDVGISYWTISPNRFGSGEAYVFYVSSNGNISAFNYVGWTIPGVRPVINLRANVSLTGSGTTSDPFKVVGAS